MKLQWNKVTWYSKLLAAILILVVIPALSAWLGALYGMSVALKSVTIIPLQPSEVMHDSNPAPRR
jgi:hypothetical protein